MSSSIKTNQLRCSLDRNAISKQFDFYSVSSSDKYFAGGAQVLDAEEFDKRILAVLFERGSSFYVMTKAGELSVSLLRNALKNSKEGNIIKVSSIDPGDLSDKLLIQIMMNSLGNFESSFLRFSNLTGHVYCLCPAWIKHGKKDGNHIIWQIPSLELMITDDLCLEFPVRTFTSVKLKAKITFDKRQFSDYPKYVLTGKNTLRRQLKEESGECFILRQLDNQKSSVPFMSIKDIDSFNQSKMGIVLKVLEDFNTKFTGMAVIAFSYIREYESVDYTRSCAKQDLIRIDMLLKEQPIRIVDTINNVDSEQFCEDIGKLLLKKYGVKASVGKYLSKKALNIRIIHNEEYYTGMNDPHRTYQDTAVQHVTFEDFFTCAEFAIDTVIHELLIKRDLTTMQISLFDWPALGFDQPISFGLPAEIDGKSKYVFMTVMPDGHFDIEEEEFDLFHMTRYQNCINIFEDAKTKHENIQGLIRLKNDQINIIKDTGWIGIPEIESIRNELASGNTKLRGKEAREELISSCLDIKSFDKDDSRYYFVGTIGEGMRYTLNWATSIRKIEPYMDAPLIYKELLPMMSVTFVHNGQLTIVPFPFKYLREYIISRGAK